jgi:glycosyltransferase involved in cell wall biosynthesis
MAVSLPVVALAAGAIPELVTDGVSGRLTANDPADLAQAIVKLLKSPGLRARFGDAARAATQRWDAPRSLAIFLDHAHRALAAKRHT